MKPRHDAILSDLMTTTEVAQHLQVYRSTLYKLIHRRQIPAFKIGADYRFKREAIEKWIIDLPRREELTR